MFMAMKEKILGNVDGFLDRELADFINKGIVTWDELCKETGGQFSVARRKRVKKLLNHADEQTPFPILMIQNGVRWIRKMSMLFVSLGNDILTALIVVKPKK